MILAVYATLTLFKIVSVSGISVFVLLVFVLTPALLSLPSSLAYAYAWDSFTDESYTPKKREITVFVSCNIGLS